MVVITASDGNVLTSFTTQDASASATTTSTSGAGKLENRTVERIMGIVFLAMVGYLCV